MTTAVLGLDALIPFAVIFGLTLAVFYVIHVVEGYEAPTSFGHSFKRTAKSVGAVGGGWFIAKLFLGGTGSLDGWEFMIGLCGAGAALLLIDFLVLTRNGHRSSE